MAIDTVLVTNVSGTAWLRQADGSLLPLREGMRVPVNAEIVTDNGSTVQLQGDGMPPLTVGENREFAVSPDLAQDDVDPTEQSVSVQADPDAARVLAALQAGEDPFEVLDPTAAVITGGGDDGGSSFTRLLSIVETTVPLALEYPRPTLPERDIQRLGGRGVNNDPESLVVDGTILAQINDDSEFIDGFDVSQYFFDADNDPLTFSATGLPPGLSIDPNTGMISGTIDRSASQGGNNGVYHVVVTATDPKGGQGNIEFTWTALNPPPVAELDTETTEENTLLEVSKENDLLSNDNDPDGDDLVVTQIENEDGQRVSTGTPIQGSNGGTLIVNPDGSYSFNPGTDFDYLADGETADVTFTYTISDGEGGTDTAQLVITVTGSNDAPVIVVPGTDDATTVTEIADNAVGENETLHEHTGTITFSDADGSDTHTVGFVPQGTDYLGSFSTTIDPVTRTVQWNFKVEDRLLDGLAANDTLTQEYVVTIDDGKGGTATQTVTVTIQGTNDGPTIVAGETDSAGSITELEDKHTDENTAVHTEQGKITFADVDLTDTHTAVITPVSTNASSWLGDMEIGSVNAADKTIDWTFTVDDAALNYLAEGEKVEQVYTVTITDNNGASTTQDITITITGANDAPVMSGVMDGTVVEDAIDSAGKVSTSGKLEKADDDLTDTHTWYFSTPGTQTAPGKDGLGEFSVDGNGNWTYVLNNNDPRVQGLGSGDEITDTIEVTVDDGNGGTDTQTITVTITGTNDAPTIDATNTDAETTVTEIVDLDAGENNTNHTREGTITFTDVDKTDVHTVAHAAKGTDYLGTFNAVVDPSTRTVKWTFEVEDSELDFLAKDQKLEQVYEVTINDGEGGTVTQSVTVTLIGTNDAPTIDVASTNAVGAVAEAGDNQPEENRVTHQSKGVIAFEDVDVVDTHVAKVEPITTTTGGAFLGQLTIGGIDPDTKTLDWTFSVHDADLDYLAAGEEVKQTYTVTITDDKGASTTQDIVITITGTNDAPTIDLANTRATGLITEIEDGATGETTADHTVEGVIAFADVDLADTHEVIVAEKSVTGATDFLGTLVLDPNYTNTDKSIDWTFTVNDGALDYLAVGETVEQVYTVTVKDSSGATTTQDIVITIVGTNDAPEMTGELTGTVTEDVTGTDGKVTASGQLDKADVDVSDTHSWYFGEESVTTASGDRDLGTFTIDQNGKWTYELNNDDPRVQALGATDTLTDTIRVTVDDGNGGKAIETITVTINGTNDIPVIVGPGTDDATTVTEIADKAAGENVYMHTHNGFIIFNDTDSSDTHTADIAEQGADYRGTFTAVVDEDSRTVEWTFTVDDKDLDDLAEGQKLEQKYDVTINDGKGGTVMQTVTVTLVGTNDAPIIDSDISEHEGGVSEDATDNTATGQLTYTDDDNDVHDSQEWSLIGKDGEPTSLENGVHKVEGIYGHLELGTDGKWTYHLDNNRATTNALQDGETVTETFTARVTDRPGAFDEQDIVITVTGSSAGASIVPDDSNGGADGHITVDEKGLTGDDTSHITDGSIKITADDGLASVTIGGQEFTLEELLALSSTSPSDKIDVGHGTITLTGFTSDTAVGGIATEGTLSFTYELGDNREHGQPGTGTDGAKTVSVDLEVTSVDSPTRPGQTSTGSLVIEVLDDTPTAKDDVNTISEDDEVQVSGNVILGDDEGGVADRVGADGATVVGVQLVGDNASAKDVAESGITELKGKYGMLLIGKDGGYIYQLDNDNAEVNALKDNDTLLEEFTYTLRDGDGDEATANLTITIDGKTDGTPSITPSDENAGVEGHITVQESGLFDKDGSHIATGSIAIEADDGLASITIGGEEFDLEALRGLTTSNGVIDLGHGTITLIGFTEGDLVGGVPTSGSLAYTYELKVKQDHDIDEGQNEARNFDVAISVKDAGGDVQAGTLGVHVKDDSPTANNDTATVLAGEKALDGTAGGFNVLTNDREGADGATVTKIEVTLTDGTVRTVDVPTDGSAITLEGKYGSLTIQANGSYSYARDMTKPGGGESDVFTYTITDGDDDTDTATLTISIVDAPVSITDLKPASEGGDVVLDEKHLTDGTEPNPNELTKVGTFTVSAPDGIADLTIEGKSIFSSDGGYVGVEVETVHGKLTITGFNPNTGTVSYKYTLSESQDHDQTQQQGEKLFDNFDIVLTDLDGDKAEGTLSVAIIDDVPTVTVTGTVVTIQVDETELNSASSVSESADFATAFSIEKGADGATTVYTLELGANINSGLVDTATNESVTLSQDTNGQIIGTSATGGLVFTISINSGTGEVTLTQHRAVKHTDTLDHNDQTTLAAGAVKVTATVTDTDNDVATASIDAGASFVFLDDGPSISLENVDLKQVSGELLTEDAKTTGSNSHTVSAGFAAIFAVNDADTSYGADGSGGITWAYSLGVVAGDSGLNSGGQAIVLSLEGDVVHGKVGTTSIFTVSVDSDGDVTLTQFGPIDHSDTNSHTEIIRLAADKITLTGTATITDGDGDTAVDSKVAEIGDLISFKDDGPSIGSPVDAVVYEAHLDHGSANTDATKTTVTGSLAVDFGADNSDAKDTQFTQETITQLESLDLTSGGKKLSYEIVAGSNGHVLTATAEGKAIFTVTIENPSTNPSYEFELQGAIDHATDSSGNTSKDQELSFNFTVTDADKDTISSSFTVNIKDDVGHEASHSIEVDEDKSVTFNTSADGTNTNITIGTGTDAPIYGTVSVDSQGRITYTPREHFSGPDSFTYTTIENGVSTTTTVTVTVNPVADTPDFVSGGAVTTDEDEAVALGLKAPEVTDNNDWSDESDGFDNPELLGVITLSGFPEGSTLLFGGQESGVPATGTVTIVLTDGPHTSVALNDANALKMTTAEFEAMQVLPKGESNKNFTVTAKVTSYEVDSGGAPLVGVPGAENSTSVQVTVKAVTDPIKLEFKDVDSGVVAKNGAITSNEDEPIDLKPYLQVSFPDNYEDGRAGDGISGADTDGSEERWFVISGVPEGSVIKVGDDAYTAGANGVITLPPMGSLSTSTAVPSITLTPPKDFSGTLENITVTLHAQDIDKDSSSENGKVETSSIDLTLHIKPVAGDVKVSDVETKEDTAVAFMAGLEVTDDNLDAVAGVATDPDSGEVITAITVKGIPEDWVLKDADGNVQALTKTDGAETYEFKVPDSVVAAKGWGGYTLTPPAHSSQDATVTLDVTSVDTNVVNGVSVQSDPVIDSLDVKITVTPVAEVVGGRSDSDAIDDLTITPGYNYGANNKEGLEDTFFKLNVDGFNLKDGWVNQDGKPAGGTSSGSDNGTEETFALLTPVLVHGVAGESAKGSQFQYTDAAGKVHTLTYNGKDAIEIPMEFLHTVEFKAPQHVSGMFEIGVQARTVDYDFDDRTITDVAISGNAKLEGIFIAPVADPVSLTTIGVRGFEDSFINLVIKPHSADPTETFDVKISDITAGSTIAYGTGDDRVEVSRDDAGNVTVVQKGADGNTETLTDVAAEVRLGELGLKVEAGTEVGEWNLIISDYDAANNPAIKPPLDSNVDIDLVVGARTVDEASKSASDTDPQIDHSEWKTQDVTVRVKGKADDAEVELITQSDGSPISVTEAVAETDGIALSSLVERITSTDTDGSETVSARLTGLPEGFTVVGGSIFTRGDGEAREWIVPLNADGSIPDTVKIKAPENYSGELTFKLVPVTTEIDGDSNTSTAVDVTVHVTPTPEATVSLESSIEEDTGGLIDFSERQPEGENEALTAVWIKASDIDGKGFVLTIGGETLASLAADDSVDYVSVGTDEYVGFIKITGPAINQIHAKPDANFADNLTGQDKLSFEFKAEITDYSDEGPDAVNPVVGPVTGVIDGTHTLNVTSVTDEVAVALVGAPDTVDLAENSVSLNIVLTKQPDANAGGKADVDGSEQFVQLLVEAPQGLLLDGMTVNGVQFNNVSYIGDGQWVLHIPADAYPTFLAQGEGDGTINATLNFTPTEFLGTGDRSVSITVVTQDAGAEGLKNDTIEWKFESTGDGPGSGDLSSIESVNYTSKDFKATEDTDFKLGDVFDLTVGVNEGTDSADNLHFSLVLDNIPEGADISSNGGVSITQIAGEDGVERWVITGTVSGADDAAKNDALKALLDNITVELPEHWNNNASTTGGFELDVTITGYLDNGSQKVNEPEPTIVPVTPVTDAGDISISFHALDADGNVIKEGDKPVHAQEGKPILISLDVSSPDDHGEQTLGDTLYFTLDTANGFTVDGTLTTRDGQVLELVDVSEAEAPTGMPAGQYYVIKAPTDGTLTMPIEVVYIPGPDDLYKGGKDGGSLTVKAWAEHTEEGATNTQVATGDSQAVYIDQVNNDYKFDATGDTVIDGDTATVTGKENSDGTGSISLNISGSLTDSDGSEVVHSAVLKGVPVGFLVFVDGALAENTGVTAEGTNTWSIPLDAEGKLPAGISIQPPQNWSGTLDGMQLSVISGEAALDSVVETTINVELTVTPVSDGIERMQPAAAFGREGEIVELRLNLTMEDNLDASIPGAQDESIETVSLELTGLGTNAAFYVRNEAGEQVLVAESQIGRQADGTYVITGLTQDQANSLGFIQAQSAIAEGGKIGVQAWTVDGNSPDSGRTDVKEFDLTLNKQAAPTTADDTLLFDGSTLLDGGAGDDTVWLRFDEDIDFAEMREGENGILFRNIEILDLTREGFDHELTNLSVQDVLDMTDSRNVLTIKADEGDTINLSEEGWQRSEELSKEATEDQEAIDVYTSTVEGKSAQLHIEADPEFLKQIADSLKANSDGSV